jgi:hypothetical protein
MNALNARLQEAYFILDTLRDECSLNNGDLWQAEQRSIAAIALSTDRDRYELAQWELCEQTYRSLLQCWHVQQSQEAQAALRRKKAWGHQMIVLLACFLSCGLFLALEMREIQVLQHKRDHPPLDDLQRTWTRILQDARRKVDSLLSLQCPRQTPEMREAQQEVFSLRKKRDMLDHQILLQEARIKAFQQQGSFLSPPSHP